MNYLFLFLALLWLTGCQEDAPKPEAAKDITNKVVLPEELKGCKLFFYDIYPRVVITVCPSKVCTTTKADKSAELTACTI